MAERSVAPFLHPAPTHWAEAPPQVQQGKNTGVPSPLPQLVCRKEVLWWKTQAQKSRGSLWCPGPSAVAQSFLLMESGNSEQSAPKLSPQKTDFIWIRVWTSLSLSMLLKTTEMLVNAFKKRLVALWEQQAKPRPASLLKRTGKYPVMKTPLRGRTNLKVWP